MTRMKSYRTVSANHVTFKYGKPYKMDPSDNLIGLTLWHHLAAPRSTQQDETAKAKYAADKIFKHARTANNIRYVLCWFA